MNGSNYVEPFVGLVAETREISYNKPPHDYSQDYLTFNITSGGTIVWTANDTAFTKTISYSKDNGATWTDITSTTAGTSFNVNAGDKVLFKGDNDTYGSGTTGGIEYNSFGGFGLTAGGLTAGFEVEGNIMSLIDSTNFATATTLTSAYTFYGLFDGCTGLTTAEHLVLPATTLVEYCYGNMFKGCSLTSAPELPATTLANMCYYNMFYGCTSLTTAPELPATTLAVNCYNCMFRYCQSLITAPELPATTLANGCYFLMFCECESLTTAPELPATTLSNSCYARMFENCFSLNYIKCLATDISADYCTGDWVFHVALSGTFVKNPNMSSWTTGDSGVPTGWTVQDAS